MTEPNYYDLLLNNYIKNMYLSLVVAVLVLGFKWNMEKKKKKKSFVILEVGLIEPFSFKKNNNNLENKQYIIYGGEYTTTHYYFILKSLNKIIVFGWSWYQR